MGDAENATAHVAVSAIAAEKRPADYVLITDLNGTLMDSDQIMFDLMVGLLRAFGYEKKMKIILEEAVRGTNEEEALKQLEIDTEKQKELENVLYKELEDKKIKLLPNAERTLSELSQLGFTFALSTDLHTKYTIRLLKENNIDRFFREDMLFTRDSYAFHKPSKKVVEEILRRSGKFKAIIIGNSLKDVKMASSADIPMVFLDYKPRVPEKDEEILNYYRQLKSERGSYTKISVVSDWSEIAQAVKVITSSY